MNIEYEITVEDDLNAKYTDLMLWLKEGKIFFISARYFPLSICIMSIAFIIWGYFTPEQSDRYTLFTGGILGLFSSIFLFLIVYRPKQLTLSSFNRRSLETEHNKYDSQQIQGRVNITPEEFIFATGNSETAWSWQALKSFKEEEKGLKFNFYSGHERFIPKRAFTSEQQIDDFKNLVQQYKSTAEI